MTGFGENEFANAEKALLHSPVAIARMLQRHTDALLSPPVDKNKYTYNYFEEHDTRDATHAKIYGLLNTITTEKLRIDPAPVVDAMMAVIPDVRRENLERYGIARRAVEERLDALPPQRATEIRIGFAFDDAARFDASASAGAARFVQLMNEYRDSNWHGWAQTVLKLTQSREALGDWEKELRRSNGKSLQENVVRLANPGTTTFFWASAMAPHLKAMHQMTMQLATDLLDNSETMAQRKAPPRVQPAPQLKAG